MGNRFKIKDVEVKIGDTIKIHYSFLEGEKEKTQSFEGIVISQKGEGTNKMFTVRKMTKDKIGVERIFPVISPFIQKIETLSSGQPRRAKLYYLRDLTDRLIQERLYKSKKSIGKKKKPARKKKITKK